jgi:hypothetical protein
VALRCDTLVLFQMCAHITDFVAAGMVEESVNLSLIEKTNLTLKTAGLNASIISVDQLRFAAPVIFVKVYEVFFGYQLEKINYSPSNRYDHAMNVDIVLNALKSRYDSPLLHQTTGSLVVSGDLRSIEIVMSIFYGIAQRIVSDREESIKNTTPPVELEPKPPTSRARSFYRSNTTQETVVTGELKVIMDRVRTLEGKVHSNIFSSEDENIHQGKEEFDNKSENAARRGSTEKSGRRSRPTSAPPGGRRKKADNTDSDTHLILTGGMDNMHEGNRGEKKQKKTKKKKKKKAAEELNDAPSPPAPSSAHAPGAERQVYDRFKSKSQSMPYARPASAGHRRPKPESSAASTSASEKPHHDFVRRSASSQQHNPNTSSSSVNGLYTYDWRTGHRISKMDSEELLEQKKQRFLSLGVVMTEEGELRALDSNVPITIHDLRIAREKQKQKAANEENHQQQAKPFTATMGEYPSRRTEQSVEEYQKKMAQLRHPEPSISKSFTPRNLSTYRHLEKYDLIVSVEHCHSCESHPMTLRHDSAEYIAHADEILKYVSQFIHSLHPCIRLGVMRFPAKLKSKKDPKAAAVAATSAAAGAGAAVAPRPTGLGRVGALEVQIGYRNQKSEVITDLIYSKLMTRRWPSKSVIEKRLASLTSHFGLQCYPDPGHQSYEGMSGEGSSCYPVGIGPWSEVPLSDPLWKYTIPVPEEPQPDASVEKETRPPTAASLISRVGAAPAPTPVGRVSDSPTTPVASPPAPVSVPAVSPTAPVSTAASATAPNGTPVGGVPASAAYLAASIGASASPAAPVDVDAASADPSSAVPLDVAAPAVSSVDDTGVTSAAVASETVSLVPAPASSLVPPVAAAVAPAPTAAEEAKPKNLIPHVRWCFDSRAYAFFPKFPAGAKVKVQQCPNPYGEVESYSCPGVIQTIYKDSALENIAKVQLKYLETEVTVHEDLCISFTEIDHFAPPEKFQTTSDDLPLVLSQLIQFGIAHDLVHWRILNSNEDVAITSLVSPGTHLKLSQVSFSCQIQELVWKAIKASPGTTSGLLKMQMQSKKVSQQQGQQQEEQQGQQQEEEMRGEGEEEEEGDEVDVQLAYSPVVLEHIFKKYGKTVNMTHLMKTIQPTLTDSQIQRCYSQVAKASSGAIETKTETGIETDTEKSSSQVTGESNEMNKTLNSEGSKTSQSSPENQGDITQSLTVTPVVTSVSSVTPIAPSVISAEDHQPNKEPTVPILNPAPAPVPVPVPLPALAQEETDYPEDFDINDPTQLSLSFMLIELSYANRAEGKRKSLTLELSHRGIAQSCSISGLEGQTGKRHMSDLDWNPIIFRKTDLMSQTERQEQGNSQVFITLSHRKDAIGTNKFSLKSLLSSPL